MSDSYFIGTVARIHNLPPSSNSNKGGDIEPRKAPSASKPPPLSPPPEQQADEEKLEISMMVSLDHTIYFHSPQDFRADEWFMMEAESPWAGDGRGVVVQNVWTQGGTLIATCFQEVSTLILFGWLMVLPGVVMGG
jgi:acyl-CoA thioesterase 8